MQFKIDHKSPVPLHAQVEELLRDIIKDEVYQKGEILPSEIEIAKKLAVSRSTVRQAIKKLVFEGLLIRKKRIGTRVAPVPVSSKSNNWLSFSQEMKVRGIPIKNFELHLSWVNADDDLARFFEIQRGKPVLKMERLRGKPDEPFVYFISYFHPRIGLDGEEDFNVPLYEMLEKNYSVVATLSKEQISATEADSFVSGKLRIKEKSPVLFRKRYVFDQGERPFEYNLGYYKGDSFFYTIESTR